MPEDLQRKSFFSIDGPNGPNGYAGDLPNALLFEGTQDMHSVWAYISGAMGDFLDQLPNIGELARIVARELGGLNYWRAPVDEAYLPKLNPKTALDRYWLKAEKLLTRGAGHSGLAA